MAKRYTDTDKWKKPFIRSMEAPYKLLFLYILDECDHAGIWQVDFDVAQIKIGEKLKPEKAIQCLSEKIHVFDEGEKWLIPDFLEFQYGELNPENRVHNSVLILLKKYNLWDLEKGEFKGLVSPFEGSIYKDMDKDKEKDGKKNPKKNEPPKIEDVLIYFKDNGFSETSARKAFEYYNVADWVDSKGNKVRNWKQKMQSVWFKDEYKIAQTLAETPIQRIERLRKEDQGR